MKNRWRIVKQDVYRLLSTTEVERRLPNKLEAVLLEEKLKEYIGMLTKKSDKSTTSAKTTEMTSSSSYNEAWNDLILDAERDSDELEITPVRKRKEPPTDSAHKPKRVVNELRVSSVGTSVAPSVSHSTVSQSGQKNSRDIVAPSFDEDDVSVGTAAQFVPQSSNITTNDATESFSVEPLYVSEADRDIWHTYLRYNDPDLPYTTKLPSLNAPPGVATILQKKYNLTHKMLSLRLQRLWRTHQQHRTVQPVSTAAALAPSTSHTTASIPQNVPSTSRKEDTTHFKEHAASHFTLESETDREIWEMYLKYNDPDEPIASGQPSFRAQRGVLKPLREKLQLKHDQMQQRLMYLWYKYKQMRASSQGTHPEVVESTAPPCASSILVPAVEPPAPASAPSLLPPSASLPAAYCLKFTPAQNDVLWQAFMKQRQFRPLPPRRVDNVVSENLLSVAFVGHQAQQMGCKYYELRAHLKSMIFAHQTPKTTFSAQEDDYMWLIFQQLSQRDAALPPNTAIFLSQKFQCRPELVTERLQILIAQRSVSSDGADVVTPEPVPRLSQAPTPAVKERAHVPTPHSATTNAPTVLQINPLECQKKCSYTFTSAEELAAQLDAATHLPPTKPSSRYVTRSRVATTSRTLQEVNDAIWTAYIPFDHSDMHLQELPRHFLPDLANRLSLPTSVVKERLRGLILEHHPPPPPPSPPHLSPVASALFSDAPHMASSAPAAPEVKHKRKRRRSKEEMQLARASQMMKAVPATEQSASPAATSDAPLTGLMAALAEAATSLVDPQDEPMDEEKEAEMGEEKCEGKGEENGVDTGREGNRESDYDRGSEMLSVLTTPSDDSDMEDSKRCSVLSSRFIFTPLRKLPHACVSASASAEDTPQLFSSPPQMCAVNKAHAEPMPGDSIPVRSGSPCDTAASSASSDLSSVTTDSSCGPFPLPFSPREDAYLWGVALPAYYNHQPLTEVYQIVQKKLNRSYQEISARMEELVQQRRHEQKK